VVAEVKAAEEQTGVTGSEGTKPPQQARAAGTSSSRGGHLKPSANRRDHFKFNPPPREPSDDPVEIRKQVEFYFSDSNLPMDKFLVGLVGGSKNNPVEISLINSFKRMKHFAPPSAVVSALKESQVLDVIDDKFVRRKVPLSESALGKDVHEARRWFEDKTTPRSIYAVRLQ
jgi:lupus La protein